MDDKQPLSQGTLVYKFLPYEYGLEAIKRKRLKLSEINSLNDPYEFTLPSSNGSDQPIKAADAQFLLLSLSKTYAEPLLWSHYADSHKGLCLEFSVIRDGCYSPMDYEPRPMLQSEIEAWKESGSPESDAAMVRLAGYLKYEKWAYEDEVRVYIDGKVSRDRDGGLYFKSFDAAGLELRRVILGCCCKVSPKDFLKQLKKEQFNLLVPVNKVKKSSDAFEMIFQNTPKKPQK